MDFTCMKEFMDRLTAWRMPGNSICVYHGGREVFRYSSGYADLENRLPMQGHELLNIYSCSKVATVTAAMQLYERGFFLLDDPLYEYVPAFRDMSIRHEDGSLTKAENPITLRHLFTMTSGLDYNTDTGAFRKARELTDGRMDTLTVLSCLAEEPLSFEPGTRWQYGLSHDVLAGVVEVISGKKFRDYMKEHIFEPLDMCDTVYHNEPVLGKMAEQYRFVSSDETDIVKLQISTADREGGYLVNAGKAVSLIFGSEYDSGGAGITTSVPDYGKFVCALANGGLGMNGQRILSKSSIELLRTNQLTQAQAENFNWGQHKGYGYGLGVKTLTDRAASGSTGSLKEFGWGGAAGATVLVDADTGLAAFYAHHMLNPYEHYYQPRLRNVLYTCMNS